MSRIRKLATAAALSCTLLASAACTTPPAGGGPILAMGDVEDDVRIGREAHPQILQQYGGEVGDPRVRAYVERVGNRLKNVSELAEIDFTFTVLDSEVVNAFALPGGYVYVTRGLIALADDEAELAGVIGHEIGHVTARHGAARQTTGQIVGTLGAIGGALLGGYLGGEAGARAGGQFGQTASYGLIMTYSHSQEYEADQLGVRYLDRAGYDAQAMADFLEALQTSAELQAKLAGVGSRQAGPVDSFFSSHPNAPDRVVRARARAAERAGSGSERNRPALLAVVDGLLHGQSPEQGFVRGQRFEHPVMRIAFEYPAGYRLINRPDAVIGRGDGRLVVFDVGRAERATGPAQYLQSEWPKGARLSNVESFRSAGGLDGAIGFGNVKLNNKDAQAGFVALAGPDRQFYHFALLTGRMGQSEARELRAVADSLRRLSAAEAAALKPTRIRLVTVQPGDTIDSLARRMEVERLPREHFVTLNGLDRGRELVPGERVKILVRG